ncbi:flagellar export chaperone FliS [Thermincola potens]|uniref:Flagellar secretion chaperone FliS n=1 Tax=Thermincola potens (strain JR) TaxID=635013 RepID=D5XCT5_THEPJ|nr:flagellar export chaperone FliS [Thermincola potens]ADG83611.1 flagellar protein FliS [Thermincola potens JR]
MQVNPYSQYKQISVQTASPEQLVVMLYDGAIKFLHLAKEAVARKNMEDTNKYIGKTQDIINEFIVSLDMSAGEIAHNLYNIYDYWNRRLIQANIKKDPDIIAEVLGQVQELREVWAEAAVKSKEGKNLVAGGVNIEG